MKVTSFKDVETYIYSSVIMPLKALNVPSLDIPSPIRGNRDREWSFQVRQAPLTREFRRNYQRTQAQRRSNMQVVLFTGSAEYVVASYNRKQHWVKIYERPFRVLKAMPLLGKLYEGFYQNTPFSKIITEMDAPRERAFRHRNPLDEEPVLDDYPYGDEADTSMEDDL